MAYTNLLIEIIGWIGAALVLSAYVLLSTGRVNGNSLTFQYLNVIGASAFVVNTFWHGALPSAILNLIWASVGMLAIGRILGWNPTQEPVKNKRAFKSLLPPKISPHADNSDDKIKERTRTLDHIKRLYAVVMGFAATECLKNIIAVIRESALVMSTSDAYLVKISSVSLGLSFVSLMILFYLASERYLDKRYLTTDSPAATREGLAWDIICLVITASWFVVLAESIPSKDDLIELESVRSLFMEGVFVKNLMILYAIDVGMIVIQLFKAQCTEKNDARKKDIVFANQVWILINLASISVVMPVFYNNKLDLGSQTSAIWFCVLHIIRITLDFWYTFRFYYPVGGDLDET